MASKRVGGGDETWADQQISTDRAQTALSLLRTVLVATIVVMIATLFIWFLSRRNTQLLYATATLALLATGAALFPPLHRRGHTVFGIRLFLFAFITTVVANPLLLPEMLPAAGICYVVIIMMGNLLLGDVGSRWLIVFCVGGFMGDIVMLNLVSAGWFPALDGTISLILSAAVGFAVLGAGALVVRLTVLSQERALRRSIGASREIERRVRLEQEGHERLQAANKEIQRSVAVEREGRQRLQQVLGRVSDAVGRLGSAAAEILASTTQQVSTASQQSAAISQTTTTVDEVRTIAEQTVARAQEVAEAAQRSVEIARTGDVAVGETIESMALIKGRVEGIAENILALSEQTQQIGQIISTVNDIATQSNMLALNASVEAARAGEQGKGFAVVAMEVRSLAEQSRQATGQVEEILSDIQRATNMTVMAT